MNGIFLFSPFQTLKVLLTKGRSRFMFFHVVKCQVRGIRRSLSPGASRNGTQPMSYLALLRKSRFHALFLLNLFSSRWGARRWPTTLKGEESKPPLCSSRARKTCPHALNKGSTRRRTEVTLIYSAILRQLPSPHLGHPEKGRTYFLLILARQKF